MLTGHLVHRQLWFKIAQPAGASIDEEGRYVFTNWSNRNINFVGPNSLVYEGSLSVELFCGGGNERQAIQ